MNKIHLSKQAPWKEKLIMFGACSLYFVKSFFLWDNLTDRTRLNKMIPATDTWTMLDTFQEEFGFNLFVYGANIWIVFNGDGVENMVLDCLAMEFLMNLDNEFEQMYFEYLPEAAIDIYDNVLLHKKIMIYWKRKIAFVVLLSSLFNIHTIQNIANYFVFIPRILLIYDDLFSYM